MKLFFSCKIVLLVNVIMFLSMAALSNNVYAGTQKTDTAMVSYYGGGGLHECGKNRPCHGSRTACGNVYDKNSISTAHKSLPCGTKVKFCYDNNCLVAEVEDRGPYIEGRSFDLSFGAAKKLGFLEEGVVEVKVTILF